MGPKEKIPKSSPKKTLKKNVKSKCPNKNSSETEEDYYSENLNKTDSEDQIVNMKKLNRKSRNREINNMNSIKPVIESPIVTRRSGRRNAGLNIGTIEINNVKTNRTTRAQQSVKTLNSQVTDNKNSGAQRRSSRRNNNYNTEHEENFIKAFKKEQNNEKVDEIKEKEDTTIS